jgi:hypothetical protein
MIPNVFVRRLTILLSPLMILTIVLLLAIGMPATAQDSAPTATPTAPVPVDEVEADEVDLTAEEDPAKRYNEPATVTGEVEAEWTLSDSQFTSNFPDGFSFSAKASSSAGELVSASVFYSHNPHHEDDFRARGEVDPETGEVSVVVEGNDAEGIPQWVEMNYRWRITDSAGTVFLSEWFTGAEYEDNTREWLRLESEDAIVFLQDGLPAETLQLAMDALEQNRPRYETVFGRTLSYKPRIIIYADRETFLEWRSLEAARSGTIVVGQTSSAWGGIVQFMLNEDLEGLALSTIPHEVAHLYQDDVYDFAGPGWWIEGNAVWFEVGQDYDYEQRVRDLAAIDEIPPLFVDGGPNVVGAGADGRGRLGYDIGYTFNIWLVENFGVEAQAQIADELSELEDIPFFEIEDEFYRILEEVTGMELADIEQEWRLWLGASPAAPTLIPTPTLSLRFPPTNTPFQFPTSAPE